MIRAANRVKIQSSGCTGDSNLGLEEKVLQLQETLKTFRAEVDLKMTIMEQILTTRNEQFAVQKKLLEREHSLYESVLNHWKNTAELAANGLTLTFSDNTKGVDVVVDDESGERATPISLLLGKRSSPSAARRGRRKRHREFKAGGVTVEESGSDGFSDSDNSVRGEGVAVSEKESDEDDDDGLERKIFINYYSEGQSTAGEWSPNPIWKYYLREENGKSAMCKLCDDKGVQKILKTKYDRTSPLHRHLKFTHKIAIDPKTGTAIAAAETHSSDPNAPIGLLGDAVIIPQQATADCSRRMRSPIWIYFTKFKDTEGTKARCNMCYAQGDTRLYKMLDGSTSRLHHHIKSVHGIDTKVIPDPSTSGILASVSQRLDSSKDAGNDNDGCADYND